MLLENLHAACKAGGPKKVGGDRLSWARASVPLRPSADSLSNGPDSNEASALTSAFDVRCARNVSYGTINKKQIFYSNSEWNPRPY